jgi:hypothetical protein
VVPGRFILFDAPRAAAGHPRGPAFYAEVLRAIGAVVVVGLDGAAYDPTPMEEAGLCVVDLSVDVGDNDKQHRCMS